MTFLASTGDNGASASKAGSNGPAPLYPSVSPLVVAVGGTTLSVGGHSGNYTWVSETGWSYTSDSYCPTCASGGGISTEYSAPSYQSDNGIDLGNGYRTVPDVSSDADPSTGVPVYDPYDFGSSTPWEQIGGTSLASPTWAAFIAIADQGREELFNEPALDGPDQTLPELYALGGTSDSPTNYNDFFHDITVGNNGYNAGTGYDLVTGIGSPIANNLLPALAATGAGELEVTTLAATAAPGLTSLPQALANATTLGGSQTITFAPGLGGTITLSSGLVISSNVTIDGPGDGAVTVSGGGPSSNFSVFTVNSGVTATISGLDIADGYTSGNGGGIFDSGNLTLSSDTVSGNSAASGGGIDNTGTVTLINDTFSGNSATSGGAIDNAGTATLSDDTINGNSAGSGGGILNSGTATLNNTIVANSTSGGDISGSVSGNNNLVDNSASAGGLTNGNGGNLVGVNPLLAPLGEYGGPTPTLALLPGSPAIDAGEVLSGISTDQRGAPRPSSGAVDIGAFQDQGYTVAVASGSGQATTLGSGFPNPLVAVLTENYAASPIPGVTLSFSAPASGATATLSAGSGVTSTSGQVSITAVANNTAGGYTVTASAAGVASTADFSLTNQYQPAFSNLADPTIVYGTATVTLSGTILTGSTAPPGDVMITLDGSSQSASIGSSGGFSSVFNTASLGVNGSPYAITYAYAANGDYAAVTNTSETLTVTPAPLTASIIGDPTKSYNGTTAATLTSSNFSLSGLVTGQSFTVTQTVGTYNSPNAGSATSVTATLVAGNFTAGSGTLASNYTFPTTASGAGSITPETLTASIIGDPTKTYNGNTSATLTSGNFSLSGLIGTQSFTVTQTSGTYNSKDVATATTVTASLSSGNFTPASGTLTSNYNLPTTASGAGQITPAGLTVTGITAANKVYNANTAAALNTSSATLVGVFSGDTVTLGTSGATGTFASDKVGTGITVTVAGLTLIGAQAGNYTLTQPTTTANITQAPLTITAVTNTKVYDGTTTAAAIPTVSGLAGSDTVTNLTETYASPNVGTGITLSVATYTVNDGNNGNNYAVTLVSNNTGVITAAAATATFDGKDTTTKGNWIGTYGSLGYDVIGAGSAGLKLPSDVTVTPSGELSYTWANPAPATATQALEVPPSGATRIAATWYSAGSFTVDVDVTDSQSYNLELYVLDYDTTTRAEQIQFTNATTGAVLSTQTVSSFSGGAYMNYTISGNVLITITKTAGANAVLSGLFFSPLAQTSTGINSSLSPSTYGQSVTFTATVSDTIGSVPTGTVEFYDGKTDLGHGTALSGSGESATSTFTTSALSAGTHSSITAVYTPSGNFAGSSGSVSQTVNPFALTITATGVNKVYDGTTTATVTLSANPVNGDSLTETYTSAVFSSRNAGNGQTVNVSGITISGAAASNYTYNTTATTTANITQAPLTITAVTNTKVYDGTTTAAAIPTVSGLVGSDTVTNLTETYASPNVGTGITLSVATYTVNDGNNGNNYAVTLVSNNTGVITAAAATATFDGKDTTTKGNWIGTYGSLGYDVIGAGQRGPQAPLRRHGHSQW